MRSFTLYALSFDAYGVRSSIHLFFAQVGTSYGPIITTSNWPPPAATSFVTWSRSVFSSSVTYLTLMVGCDAVKPLGVSFWMSTICGLSTTATVMVCGPLAWPELPPPDDEQAATAATVAVANAEAISHLPYLSRPCTGDLLLT